VNSSHRISLTAQWNLEQKLLLEHSEEANFSAAEFIAVRKFHLPTGLTRGQRVCFRFQPPGGKVLFFLNGRELSWNTIGGLATVTITSMMEPTNRVELRWRGIPQANPHLPEHFKAWLEISNDEQLDP
jgi:hypothetical protein